MGNILENHIAADFTNRGAHHLFYADRSGYQLFQPDGSSGAYGIQKCQIGLQRDEFIVLERSGTAGGRGFACAVPETYLLYGR